MAGIIPKEELTSFQRWEIGSFDRPTTNKRPQVPPPSPPAPEPGESGTSQTPAPAAISSEDLESLKMAAQEAGHQAGFQAGYAEGQQAAAQEAREAALAQLERFQEITEGLHQALNQIDQSVAEQLLELAVEISEKIVGSVLAIKPEMLLPIVREALANLPVQQAEITLSLNPADAATIRQHLGEQFAQTGVLIIENDQISPGGCQLRAGVAEIDASLETRWKRVLGAIGANPRQWLNTNDLG